MLGTAVAVGRVISGAAGPSPAEELVRKKVHVEEVDDKDDGDPPPLLPRESIAPPLLDRGEGKSDG